MATTLPLSSQQRRRLRGLAHELRPVVQLGKGGAGDAVLEAVDDALHDHELIKVRLPQVAKAERVSIAEAVSGKTQSTLVGLVGRVLILYRAHPEKPKIRV